MIPNPAHFEEPPSTSPLHRVAPVGAVAFEVWTVDRGYVFDGVMVAGAGAEGAAAAAEYRGSVWRKNYWLEVRWLGGWSLEEVGSGSGGRWLLAVVAAPPFVSRNHLPAQRHHKIPPTHRPTHLPATKPQYAASETAHRRKQIAEVPPPARWIMLAFELPLVSRLRKHAIPALELLYRTPALAYPLLLVPVVLLAVVLVADAGISRGNGPRGSSKAVAAAMKGDDVNQAAVAADSSGGGDEADGEGEQGSEQQLDAEEEEEEAEEEEEGSGEQQQQLRRRPRRA